MATMNRNIPLSIDNELLAEIDRAAEASKSKRSEIMRRAIRAGLPLVQAGASADMVSLDSELSKDVDQISKDAKLSRAKVIIECIRTGAQAFYNRVMREQVIHSQEHKPEEAESLLATMETWHHADEPMNRELRTALRQRGAAMIRLWDLLTHVPEAWRRHQLVEKLTKARLGPGGIGGTVWGHGLSTEEVEWQVNMAEKYGPATKLPEHEVAAREAARKQEDTSHRRQVAETLGKLYPPDWKP